jgi:hypothetical protein
MQGLGRKKAAVLALILSARVEVGSIPDMCWTRTINLLTGTPIPETTYTLFSGNCLTKDITVLCD